MPTRSIIFLFLTDLTFFPITAVINNICTRKINISVGKKYKGILCLSSSQTKVQNIPR